MPHDEKLAREAEIAAEARFDPEKFERVDNVCVFAEHETDHDGETLKLGEKQLAEIADKCNFRAADTGDFAPLTSGHTPTKEDKIKGAAEPDILGFVGACRLGEIGNKEPKTAIFCTEYHRKDRSEQIKSLPRRSPELWLTKDPKQRFFDPVAALGAETPRLDLGLAFQRVAGTEGALVRYAAEAVAANYQAFPSGSNVALKDEDILKNQESDMPDVKDIIQAIESLDWVQWVKDQMAAEGSAAAPEAELTDEDRELMARYMEHADDEEKEKYENMNDEEKLEWARKKYQENDEEKEEEEENMTYSRKDAKWKAKYSRLESEKNRLKRDHENLKSRVDGLLRDRTDEARYARLQEATIRYQLDLDEEGKRCLYGSGSSMTDEQFDGHMSLIENHYRERPVGQQPIHRFAREAQVAAASETEKERYEKQISEDAVRIATDHVNSTGKAMPLEEARAKAREKHAAGNGTA